MKIKHSAFYVKQLQPANLVTKTLIFSEQENVVFTVIYKIVPKT